MFFFLLAKSMEREAVRRGKGFRKRVIVSVGCASFKETGGVQIRRRGNGRGVKKGARSETFLQWWEFINKYTRTGTNKYPREGARAREESSAHNEDWGRRNAAESAREKKKDGKSVKWVWGKKQRKCEKTIERGKERGGIGRTLTKRRKEGWRKGATRLCTTPQKDILINIIHFLTNDQTSVFERGTCGETLTG